MSMWTLWDEAHARQLSVIIGMRHMQDNCRPLLGWGICKTTVGHYWDEAYARQLSAITGMRHMQDNCRPLLGWGICKTTVGHYWDEAYARQLSAITGMRHMQDNCQAISYTTFCSGDTGIFWSWKSRSLIRICVYLMAWLPQLHRSLAHASAKRSFLTEAY